MMYTDTYTDIETRDPYFPTRAVADLSTGERAMVYRWLAGHFAREPQIDTLLAYRADDSRALLQSLAEVAPLTPLANEFLLWVEETSDQDLKVIAGDLAGEFAKLFLGVGRWRSAPPYRSFYTGQNGRLMQAPAVEMQRRLRDHDIRIAEHFPEPADHIAVQLSMMARLAETGSAWEQVSFLETQVMDWVGRFYGRCAAASTFGFYTTAAAAVADFTHSDLLHLRG